MEQDKRKERSFSIDLISRDEVDSTNDELRRSIVSSGSEESRGQQAQHNPEIIRGVVALSQTKGRGRLGREWSSPFGGLYLSLALDISAAGRDRASLSLLVALAVRSKLTSLVATCKEEPDSSADGIISCKWPNDLICTSGKLAGILIETLQLSSDTRLAIVGIGINVHRSSQTYEGAACLSDLCEGGTQNVFGSAINRETGEHAQEHLLDNTSTSKDNHLPNLYQIAEETAISVVEYYEAWQRSGCSFASFLNEYNTHLCQIGKRVVVCNSHAEVISEGEVRGVDCHGCLLLADSHGDIRHISSGEVTLRTENTKIDNNHT